MGCILSQELKAANIPVQMLHPGFNRTAMTQKYAHIWDIEGAVEPHIGAKRVLYEILRADMATTGTVINCAQRPRPWVGWVAVVGGRAGVRAAARTASLLARPLGYAAPSCVPRRGAVRLAVGCHIRRHVCVCVHAHVRGCVRVFAGEDGKRIPW
jgi:hypothetical protein